MAFAVAEACANVRSSHLLPIVELFQSKKVFVSKAGPIAIKLLAPGRRIFTHPEHLQIFKYGTSKVPFWLKFWLKFSRLTLVFSACALVCHAAVC